MRARHRPVRHRRDPPRRDRCLPRGPLPPRPPDGRHVVNDETNLLEVSDLSVHFRRGHGSPVLRAVDRVSFSVAERETLGVVGESGSGKNTIGRAVLGLVPPTDGRIEFAGEDITRADHRRRRALSRDLQVIFQDPYSSLNPTAHRHRPCPRRPTAAGDLRRTGQRAGPLGPGPSAQSAAGVAGRVRARLRVRGP
ncbi:ATP-binding cassette domain-containing protein [Streptomyces sp. FxanaA7]|uniref:ATP-binding cassette domain-containing protein n=1 Tax=Streptomyces sp. FxanaA7 TaxID=1265492 RepID=UPI002D21A9E6|nr:ATP-binding cassette domain-containing protein [Streptomyces sp. FxanaA7]